MDALRAVLELALKDKALSFEARRQLVAAEASAYADAASVVQGKANAAATALAAVNLKDTMKAGDRRQYDDGYAESIAELMSEFEVQPRMVRKLVLKVLRAHTTVPWPFYPGARGTARACVVEALYPARFALDSLRRYTSSDD